MLLPFLIVIPFNSNRGESLTLQFFFFFFFQTNDSFLPVLDVNVSLCILDINDSLRVLDVTDSRHVLDVNASLRVLDVNIFGLGLFLKNVHVYKKRGNLFKKILI